MRKHVALVFAAMVGFALSAAPADEGEGHEPKDEIVTTEHSATIAGETIDYTVHTGTMVLPSYDGEPRAEIFFIAYLKNGVEDPATRPITFSFNGGPGSSSVWLHLGVLAPVRVDMGPEGFGGPPPSRLVENEHSILDLTDLVFIDPVSTGYSRPVDGVSAKDFHGLREDIQSVADFIRLWTTRNERWSSPKMLIGESYGTTRAAGLAGYLQNTHGMFLNGVMLVSPVLNFQTIRFNTGNDTPFWNFLPTYTATAFYHGMLEGELAEDLERTVEMAERWAETDYLTALAKGDRLTGEERAHIREQLAAYTGLSEEFLEQSDLRVNIFNFTKELLRHKSRTVGRLDSRFVGMDRLDVGDSYEWDPSMVAILGPYTAMLNDLVRRQYGYKNDHVYEILTGRVRPWSYAGDQNRYVNVAETLRSAMHRNPWLKVWVSAGYYDLATPHFAAEYTVDQMQLDASVRDNVMFTYYEAGHMMYIHEGELEQFREDAVEFIDWAIPD